MLVVCISVSIWLLILWLWNSAEETAELWPAPVPSHSQDGAVSKAPMVGFWCEMLWGFSWFFMVVIVRSCG